MLEVLPGGDGDPCRTPPVVGIAVALRRYTGIGEAKGGILVTVVAADATAFGNGITVARFVIIGRVLVGDAVAIFDGKICSVVV